MMRHVTVIAFSHGTSHLGLGELDQWEGRNEANVSQGLAASEPLERNGSLDPFSGNASGPVRMKPVRNTSESSGSRRLFFRHAASAESLHSRSVDFSTALSTDQVSHQFPKISHAGRSRRSCPRPNCTNLLPPAATEAIAPSRTLLRVLSLPGRISQSPSLIPSVR